ncbi:MAG: ABC transporter permease [Pseudomonadota bacterium]
MLLNDFIRFSLNAVKSYRLRSFLTALGIAVGIAAVVLLVSIGKGVQLYVISEFTQFGTNLIAVNPGKTTTSGVSGALISNVRPLRIEDSLAIKELRGVEGVVPFVQGNAPVEFGKLSRRTYIFGVGPQVPLVWRMQVAMGRFLPEDDPRAARAFVVLGSKVKEEIFRTHNPLGSRIRIGGEQYRVVGVMESKGQMLGFDLDDAVYIPAGRALGMFDRESLMEIDLVYAASGSSDDLVKKIRSLLFALHGSEDFTITTQEQMLDALGSVLNILTLAVAALGGISLVVGGVGILTIMTIGVNERTAEIGLLRALGAGRRQIVFIFLGEAILLAGIGGLAGLVIGTGGAWLIGSTVPALPTHTPWSYVAMAEALAALVGLLSGALPALRAANLNPIEALRAE